MEGRSEGGGRLEGTRAGGELGVGEGHGEGVGGVVGDGGDLDVEELGDEEGDLLLGGVAEAADGLLDLARGVLEDGDVGVGEHGDDGAAGGAEDGRGADILAVEAALDDGEVGMVLGAEVADGGGQVAETGAQRQLRLVADDAAVDGGHPEGRPPDVDDAPAGAAQGDVESDDALLRRGGRRRAATVGLGGAEPLDDGAAGGVGALLGEQTFEGGEVLDAHGGVLSPARGCSRVEGRGAP